MTVNVAKRIEQHRAALGWNQRAAAGRADISQATWSRIESGEKEPTLGQLSAIAIALGVTLESLTDANPVRERLHHAARLNKRNLSEEDRTQLEAAQERLRFVMEVNAHLRYIGVGIHHA
ncbi:hypothetical protein BIU95_00180 [Curtobacterium sp. MCBA15_007]|uniref:helix-turn-helix transcriptional regulator n=1 Tax=Curtobacterium TaxID=2034 RepID=UPI00039C618E|nr:MULTISPECIES: helix-turn-helix transcriptional regulator [Curtobacterium]EYT66383.1 transcriptional regulator [Curtobacterium flaccumfaciens UCD-AKU]OII09543.1 hypothetical protein BIU95_00180 [Curtobacterium sp. MCBA15_007]